MTTIKETIKTYSHIKRDLRKILKKEGATKIEIFNCYYFFSGFCTFGKKIIYFSCRDTRDEGARLLFRIANDYSDYKGGKNHFSDLDDTEISKIITKLIKL